jgi:hypothetical protein
MPACLPKTNNQKNNLKMKKEKKKSEQFRIKEAERNLVRIWHQEWERRRGIQ